MPIGDSTPTSRWPRTGQFVRTCRGTVLQYVENKVPLALKRNVAAHRFLNKICLNEDYLSGPKVCRSNLETPCIGCRICRRNFNMSSMLVPFIQKREKLGSVVQLVGAPACVARGLVWISLFRCNVFVFNMNFS